MTIVTEREIRSPHNGRVPQLDSPPAPARAGARIPLTERVGNLKHLLTTAARRWWLWTARPSSLRTLWRTSAVDPKRVPGNSRLLRVLWHISNWTDRILLFVLVLVLPTGLQGPLRYITARPTRRWGFYILSVAGAVTYVLGRY